MFRAVLELLFTILVVMVVRAVIGGLMKGLSSAGPRPAAPRAATQPSQAGPQIAGQLHRDPVCGTYVAETTLFRRVTGNQTFYYCSGACREKHSLVAQ